MALFGLSFDKEKAKRYAQQAAAKGGAVLKAGANAGAHVAKEAAATVRHKIEEKKEENRKLNIVYREELFRQKIIAAKEKARDNARPGNQFNAFTGTPQKDQYGLFGSGRKKKRWF